jgi:hypothetical protein
MCGYLRSRMKQELRKCVVGAEGCLLGLRCRGLGLMMWGKIRNGLFEMQRETIGKKVKRPCLKCHAKTPSRKEDKEIPILSILCKTILFSECE